MSDCRFGVSPVNYPDPDPKKNIMFYQKFSGCPNLGSSYRDKKRRSIPFTCLGLAHQGKYHCYNEFVIPLYTVTYL